MRLDASLHEIAVEDFQCDATRGGTHRL